MKPELLKPPVYCPDALATDIGWINPKNGEVLILVKNLRKQIADYEASLNPTEESATLVEVETPPVETKTETPVEETPAPVKRGRGRPRKNPQ